MSGALCDLMDAKSMRFFYSLDCAALSIWHVGMIQFLRPYPRLFRFHQGRPITYAINVMGGSDVVLNLKKEKTFFFF
jgi:hypothetical protein